MSLPILAASGAALLMGLFLVLLATGRLPHGSNAWRWPAACSALLLAWSLAAMGLGGPLGFWTEHIRNLWGVQIFFDLLLAIAVALAFLVPAARAQGMRVTPWLLLIGCTGSIGVLAMAARLMWLRHASALPSAAPA
ncbi:MAG: hypothetical protein AAF366_06845 [Pseudomonadota bacterium]